MERKLLFFDIDGTLIPDIDSPIPDSTKEALRLAREKGHYTFINTGRPRSILPEAVLELPFDGYLCGCGSHITLGDQLIVDKQLEPKRCQELLLHAREKSMPIILEGNDYCYLDSMGATHPILEHNNLLLSMEFTGRILDAAQCDAVNFSKFCAISDSPERLKDFLEPFSDYFEPIDRGDEFYEIVPLGFSKASAIDVILSHLGQSVEDCYVFGDSSNDLPMLTHVPNSIAMGNSDDIVLKTASYITTTAWRDGIYLAMKHFHLI